MTSRVTPAQSVLLWGAGLFLLSALLHAAVWFAAGFPSLTGPVSWRKPIVFGASTGVLCASLAWGIGLLPHTPRLARQATAVVGLLVVEVFLIDLQQWRGVGSHFNNATPLDGAIFTLMGIFILAVAVILAVWTRALMRRRAAPDAHLVAARAAMLFLNAGNLLGIFLAAYGSAQAAQGLPPNIFGAAGQLRVPHAVALHALQVLPLVAVLAGSAAVATVRLATAGYAGVFAFTLLQTFSGRAPAEATVASALILTAGLAALAVSGAHAGVRALDRYQRSDMLVGAGQQDDAASFDPRTQGEQPASWTRIV